MDNDKTTKHALSVASGITKTFFEHNGFLRRFLRRYLRRDQDIDDVLQQAYLNVFTLEKAGGSIEEPKALLFQVAKNLALNELNRKSQRMTDFIEECQSVSVAELASATTVENELEAQQTLKLYWEAIAELPKKCRHVYILRKVHGLSHKEIAERMGITLSGVEKQLHIGMSRCREYLEKHEGQPRRTGVASGGKVKDIRDGGQHG